MKSNVNIYAIKDTVGGYFMAPYTSVNDDTALRNFEKVCSSVEYGNDFNLYRLGTYNTDTGVIEPCAPEYILNGGDFNG